MTASIIILVNYSGYKISTDAHQVKLAYLESCEEYFVGVTFTDDGRTPPAPIQIVTPHDGRSEPSCDVYIQPKPLIMFFNWNSKCALQSDYFLSITDIIVKKSKTLRTDVIGKHKYQNMYREIARGGVYEVIITSLHHQNISFTKILYAPPLPVPTNFSVKSDNNGSCVFDWDVVQIDDVE